MSFINIELYPYTHDLKLYLHRLKVKEHMSVSLENTADYNRFRITVPHYMLDFKKLEEEEKIYVLDCINRNLRFKFEIAKQGYLTDKVWIIENDREFFEKYKLLFD